MSIEWILLGAAFLLGITMIPVVQRMIVGPTILDRAVGLDMLLVYVVMGLGLYTAATGTYFAIVPALALTGTGFIGTLALARFVAREDGSERAATMEQVSAEESVATGMSAPSAFGEAKR